MRLSFVCWWCFESLFRWCNETHIPVHHFQLNSSRWHLAKPWCWCSCAASTTRHRRQHRHHHRSTRHAEIPHPTCTPFESTLSKWLVLLELPNWQAEAPNFHVPSTLRSANLPSEEAAAVPVFFLALLQARAWSYRLHCQLLHKQLPCSHELIRIHAFRRSRWTNSSWDKSPRQVTSIFLSCPAAWVVDKLATLRIRSKLAELGR